MNIHIIFILLFVIIATFAAIIIRKPILRTLITMFIYLIFVIAIAIWMDSQSRHVISVSLQQGTYTESFGDGVRALRNELTPIKLIIFVCGSGLLLISFKPCSLRKRNESKDRDT